MVIDLADHAGLVLAELADCADCGVRPGDDPRAWSVAACERHSSLLERESEPGRLVADGGFETATTEYSRRVTTRDEIETLADDIRVGTHNMWVDVRSPDDCGGYEPVTVDVTVEVVGGKPDREPLTDGGRVNPAPQPATFPAGGHTAPGEEITCDRCGAFATKGYEGAGADGFLNFCDSCFEDFGAWLEDGGDDLRADGGTTYRDVRGVMSAVDVDRPEWAQDIAVGDEIAFEAPPDGDVKQDRVIGFSTHSPKYQGCPVIEPDAELRACFEDDPDQVAITGPFYVPPEEADQ